MLKTKEIRKLRYWKGNILERKDIGKERDRKGKISVRNAIGEEIYQKGKTSEKNISERNSLLSSNSIFLFPILLHHDWILDVGNTIIDFSYFKL